MILLIPILIFVIISFINGFYGPFLSNIDHKVSKDPKVSILIPAKNEEKRIRSCLNTITNQDYQNLEIIVLDDNSTDNTFDIIKEYEPKIKVIKGTTKPDFWLGKNWACDQLSKYAQGDIFIFTDADNWYEQNSVTNTIKYIDKYNLNMISAFPENVTKTFFEKLFSSSVEHILYSLLPLWMTLRSKKSSLSAANGQWIAIKKDSYSSLGGHEAVKHTNVEDITLARKAKKMNMKILTVSGVGIIYTRMYKTFDEIIKGFSKNMYQMLGGNLAAFLFHLILFWSTIFLLFTSNTIVFIVGILLIIFWKSILSIKFRVNFFYSLLFHPFLVLFMTIIGVRSIFLSNKNIIWR